MVLMKCADAHVNLAQENVALAGAARPSINMQKDFGLPAPQPQENFAEAEHCEIPGFPSLPRCVHGNREIWACSFSWAVTSLVCVCEVCLCNFFFYLLMQQRTGGRQKENHVSG